MEEVLTETAAEEREEVRKKPYRFQRARRVASKRSVKRAKDQENKLVVRRMKGMLRELMEEVIGGR